MSDINTISIIGRLTKDPDLKYSSGGSAIMNFSIAVSRIHSSKDNKKEDTSFFDCVSFGKQAETLKQYMSKGKQVAIRGYLKQEQWQDKTTGQKKSRVIIGCEDVQLLGGRQQQSNADQYQPGYYDAPQNTPANYGPEEEINF